MWRALSLAARGLRRAPLYPAAVIGVLALGIGATLGTWALVDALMFRPVPHVTDPESVVRLYFRFSRPDAAPLTTPHTSYPALRDLRASARSVRAVAGVSTRPMRVGRGGEAAQIQAAAVTGNFFSLLGVRPALGRLINPLDDAAGAGGAYGAVLGAHYWRTRFGGDSGIIGTQISIEDRPFHVVGVLPDGAALAESPRPDVWLPLAAIGPRLAGDAWEYNATAGWIRLVARAAPGLKRRDLENDLTRATQLGVATAEARYLPDRVIVSSLHPDRGPLRSVSARLALWVAALSAALLLVTTTTVVSLVGLRAIDTRHAGAVRLALGARRIDLVRTDTVDAVLVSTLGSTAGFAVGYLVFVIASRVLLGPDGAEVAFDPARGAILASLAAIPSFIACVTAPLLVSRFSAASHALLSGRAAALGGTRPLRRAVTVAQVAGTCVLLVCAVLFGRGASQMAVLELGVDAERLYVASVELRRSGLSTPHITELFDRVAVNVAGLGGVERIAVATSAPFVLGMAMMVYVPDRPGFFLRERGLPFFTAVTPQYFATVGTGITRGRTFTDADDAGARPVAVVNEAMAQLLWPDGSAVGRCIHLSEPFRPCFEIVGVAANARRFRILEESPAPQVYVPIAQSPSPEVPPRVLLVRARPGVSAAGGMPNAIRHAFLAADSTLPYVDVTRMDRLLDPQLRPWRAGARLLAASSALALALCGASLFALVAYAVRQEWRAHAVRLAVGASPARVVVTAAQQAMILAGVGSLIGLLAAAWLLPIARSALGEIMPPVAPAVVLTLGVVMGAAAAAAYLAARPLRQLNPADVLRES